MTTHSIPQGTLASALTAAGVVASNYIYFDLIGHVEDQLIDGELKARVMSSLAWSLDTRAVNYARSVFFDTYKESVETGTIDAFNDFCTAMNERAVAGDHTHEVGFEDVDSFSTLVSLLNMRKFWHDRAEACATRPYKPKSLAELVLGERARTTAPDTKAKLAIRAAYAADGDLDLEKQLLDSLIRKSDSTKQQQYELRAKLNPAVLRVLELASARATTVYDGECPELHLLPIELQRSLIEGSIGAVERGLSDMADMRNVTLDDYTVAIKESRAFVKSIHEVLKAPKFNVA